MTDELQLTDGTILIRPYRVEDIGPVYEAIRESMNELRPWMPWCHADYSIDETAAWIMSRDEAWSKGSDYGFAILDPETGAMLGSVGLNQLDQQNRTANLGYWVRTGSTRRGVATGATRLLARWGFTELGLQRIEVVAAVGNRASQRVAEKAGAVREGVMRRALWLNERAHDAFLNSLTPEDVGLPSSPGPAA